MWQKLKIILDAVLALLVIIVALQNTEQVETQLLFVSIIGSALGVLAPGRLVSKSQHADA